MKGDFPGFRTQAGTAFDCGIKYVRSNAVKPGMKAHRPGFEQLQRI